MTVAKIREIESNDTGSRQERDPLLQNVRYIGVGDLSSTVNDFTAIINDPQAAIMAVGGGNKSFVAPPPGAFPEDDLIPLKDLETQTLMMTVALSCDRRAVAEPTAALFLSCFRAYLRTPSMMMA